MSSIRLAISSSLALAAILTTGAPAEAAKPFEGVLEMKISSKMGGGNVTMFVGQGGVKSEMNMQAREMPMKMVMLVKAGNRDVGYMLDDEHKNYGEVDLKSGREMAKTHASSVKYTAKKLGTEKIGSWSCVKAEILRDGQKEADVWTSKDIMDMREIAKMMGPNAQAADEGMMKALDDAGAGGFVVKLVRENKAHPEVSMTMELVRAERKALPASTFEIPAGYTKRETGIGGPGMGGLPPEVQQKLKNLTPEQQEMLKKAMQKHGGAGK